jgi:hypothetical protein
MKKQILFTALIALAGSTLLFNGCKKDDEDVDAPVITVTGNNPDNVILNSSSNYSDAGATAHDTKDGSVAVSTSGTVDMTTAGTYTITYTAHDAAGNSVSATRTVNVNIDRSNYVWSGYAALDTAASTGYFTYSGAISAGSASNAIIISNFSGTLANCTATVNGATVTIASQSVGAYTMVGSGTMNNKGTIITLAYNDGTENHIAVLTKQ